MKRSPALARIAGSSLRGVMVAGFGGHGARHGAFGRARWPALRQEALPAGCFIESSALWAGSFTVVHEEPMGRSFMAGA
jgi:hypothetical protein